jgi:ribonuclease P/MRP protein subunit POP1
MQLDVPGSPLDRTEEDDQISILLVRVGGGWRMILANNWAKAFFHSFTFSSARLVCLDQKAQIDFEAGQPTFPRDYPTLLPATELADQEGLEEARYWGRKPPAKRVNYKLMQSKGGEGGDPFVPD